MSGLQPVDVQFSRNHGATKTEVYLWQGDRAIYINVVVIPILTCCLKKIYAHVATTKSRPLLSAARMFSWPYESSCHTSFLLAMPCELTAMVPTSSCQANKKHAKHSLPLTCLIRSSQNPVRKNCSNIVSLPGTLQNFHRQSLCGNVDTLFLLQELSTLAV